MLFQKFKSCLKAFWTHPSERSVTATVFELACMMILIKNHLIMAASVHEYRLKNLVLET